MDEYLLTRYSKYNMCNFSSIAMQLSYTYSVYIAMLLVARNEKQGMYWLCSFVGFLPAQSTLFKIGYEWFRLTVGSLFFFWRFLPCSLRVLVRWFLWFMRLLLWVPGGFEPIEPVHRFARGQLPGSPVRPSLVHWFRVRSFPVRPSLIPGSPLRDGNPLCLTLG